MSLRPVQIDRNVEAFDRQLERLMPLIDDRVGIIAAINESFREPDDPLVFNHTTLLTNSERYTGLGKAPGLNGGAGLTRARSMLGAIGETVERYACSIFDPHALVYGSYQDLTRRGHHCVDPERVALFSNRQYDSSEFRFHRFTRTTRVLWELCESLNTNPPEPVYYPSCLIYMPSFLDSKRGDVDICPAISTGQASGTTIEMATLSGLMEVVERDAYTIAWHNRLPCPRLDPSSSPMLAHVIRERFADCPVELVFNYLTLDLQIPVVIVTGVDRHSPGVSCILGVAAHLDPEIAALKALIELAQDRFYVKFLARAAAPIEPAPDRDYPFIDDFEKRVVLFLHPGMIPALDFWRIEPERLLAFSDIPNASTGDDRRDLQVALDKVKAVGGTVIRRDCTTDDLREVGLHVVKVQVPELEALEGNHNWRYFGCERLFRVPVELGYRRRPLTEAEMNPDPHPLP
jgi:ribosomal protein S12 methylthiotransferase accessory factor